MWEYILNKHLLIGVTRTPMGILSQCFFSIERRKAKDVSCLSPSCGHVLKARSGPVPGKVHSLVLVSDRQGCVFTNIRHPQNIDISVLGYNWP